MLTGCGGEAPAADACKPSVAMTGVPELPSDLPQVEGGTITKAKTNSNYTEVVTVFDDVLNQVYKEAEAAILANDFELLARDYEGFEAELFFARANEISGIARLGLGDCEGEVHLAVTYDPLQTAAGKKSVKETRKHIDDSEEAKNKT